MIDIKEKLEEVLALEEKESHSDCEIELMTLYSFCDYLEFANTEEEFYSFFEQFHQELCDILGQPIYKVKGRCHNDKKVPFPQKDFCEHQSAIYCSWWKYQEVEVMLMVTGHEADTLKYIRIAASRVELDE